MREQPQTPLQPIAATEPKAELQGRFEEALKGKFDRVQAGSFASLLPNVESINFLRPQKNTDSMHVMVYFNTERGRRNLTASFLSDGAFSADPPKNAGFTREQLKQEVLRIIESVDLEFFSKVDGPILKKGDPEDFIEPSEGGAERASRKEAPTDARRLAVLREQPDVLFGATEDEAGFNGYFLIFGKNYIRLGHNRVGNAIYELPYKHPPELSPEVFRLPASKRVPEAVRQEIIEREWTIPHHNDTKADIRRESRRRIVHPRINDPDFVTKLKAALESLKETV